MKSEIRLLKAERRFAAPLGMDAANPLRLRYEESERLAQAAFPWTRLKDEIEVLDGLVGFNEIENFAGRTPRAIYWGACLLFGASGHEMLDRVFPEVAPRIEKKIWRRAADTTPLTCDDKLLGGVVAFVAAARRTIGDGELVERLAFQRALVAQAAAMKRHWGDWFGAAARRENGLGLIEIGDGWFHVAVNEKPEP